MGLRRPDRARGSWRLPDGTRLRFVGSTYGTNHPSPLRPVWERWPSPGWVAGWLPADGWGSDWPSEAPALLLWFRTDRAMRPEESYRWDLVDESGLVVADYNALQLTATNGATGLRLDYAAFPRTGRTLRLIGQHYDRASNCFRPVLELELPNPRPAGTNPPGTAPALPQTVRAGALEFTLVAFDTALRRRPGFHREPAPPGEEFAGRLDFVTTSNGIPNRVWFPLNARLTDLEGQSLRTSPVEWLGSQQGWSLKLEPAPWPGQTWRLRVEFSRNEAFAPQELTVFAGLRVAGSHHVSVDQRQTVNGREVELSALRLDQANDGTWKAEARLAKREPGVSLTLLSARDQRGRKLWHHPRHLTFRTWRDSETVDLTFAVHASRFAEFTAEPADVRKR